jgi:hypothetical protein
MLHTQRASSRRNLRFSVPCPRAYQVIELIGLSARLPGGFDQRVRPRARCPCRTSRRPKLRPQIWVLRVELEHPFPFLNSARLVAHILVNVAQNEWASALFGSRERHCCAARTAAPRSLGLFVAALERVRSYKI